MLHLNFSELPASVQQTLRGYVRNHWEINNANSPQPRNFTAQEIEAGLDDLFNEPNSGIDVFTYSFMDKLI